MTDEFVTVAKVADVPEGQGLAVECNDEMVAIFRVGGEFHAIADACPHMGASLASGPLEADTVTCPWHAWRFRVTDGTWCDNPRVSVDSYEVRVVGDEIQVRKRPSKSTNDTDG